MNQNTILIFSIVGGIILLAIMVKIFVIGGKKEKYDLESLANGRLPEEKRDNSFLDKIGGAMGIANFKEVCLKAEEMLKAGNKQGAVDYMVETTGIERSRAEHICGMFEQRFR